MDSSKIYKSFITKAYHLLKRNKKGVGASSPELPLGYPRLILDEKALQALAAQAQEPPSA